MMSRTRKLAVESAAAGDSSRIKHGDELTVGVTAASSTAVRSTTKAGGSQVLTSPPQSTTKDAALASTSSDKERSIVDAIFSGSVGGGTSRTVQDAKGEADEDDEDEDAVLQNAILEGKKRAAVSTSAAPAQKKNQTNQRK